MDTVNRLKRAQILPLSCRQPPLRPEMPRALLMERIPKTHNRRSPRMQPFSLLSNSRQLLGLSSMLPLSIGVEMCTTCRRLEAVISLSQLSTTMPIRESGPAQCRTCMQTEVWALAVTPWYRSAAALQSQAISSLATITALRRPMRAPGCWQAQVEAVALPCFTRVATPSRLVRSLVAPSIRKATPR